MNESEIQHEDHLNQDHSTKVHYTLHIILYFKVVLALMGFIESSEKGNEDRESGERHIVKGHRLSFQPWLTV